MNATATFSNLEDTAIGIDLGTTNCAVAVCINGEVKIVPNWEQGERFTPSYVCYNKNGTELYGNAAKDQAYRNPETTIFDAKRIIGKSWDDPFLQKDIAIWPFEVVKVGDSPKIRTGTKTRSPQEISAKLLTIFRERAEKHLQQSSGSIKKAVITVPAYFNESQRRATIEAGELAGLQVLTILNEPTAAAIAYKLQTPTIRNETKTVLIYDLGGGTFDVAIVRVSKNVLITLGIHGDTHLGGQDFDNLLMEHFCKRFERETRINLLDKGNPEYRTPLVRLRQQCEIAKKTLSGGEETFIEVQSILDEHDLSDTLTREEFEDLIENLIDKSMDIAKRAIKGARDIRSKDDIDEIILIGGSTRMPLVTSKLQDFFPGKPLNLRIHPDEAVAYGAALQASILNNPNQQSEHFIIEDLMPVPCSNSLKLQTVIDNRNYRLNREKHKEINYASNHTMNCFVSSTESKPLNTDEKVKPASEPAKTSKIAKPVPKNGNRISFYTGSKQDLVEAPPGVEPIDQKTKVDLEHLQIGNLDINVTFRFVN